MAKYDYPDWFGPIWEEVRRIVETQKEHNVEQDLLNGTSRADDIFYPHPRPPEDPKLPF